MEVEGDSSFRGNEKSQERAIVNKRRTSTSNALPQPHHSPERPERVTLNTRVVQEASIEEEVDGSQISTSKQERIVFIEEG